MSNMAVCNSSCLIALERIQRLRLLSESFNTIYIPPAVQTEIGFSKSWFVEKPVQNQSLVTALETQIGAGESEAIALSVEMRNVILILDDKKARRIAQQFSPRVIGTVGILLRAKSNGLIREIKPILDELNQVDFRIKDSLYNHTLELAKEN